MNQIQMMNKNNWGNMNQQASDIMMNFNNNNNNQNQADNNDGNDMLVELMDRHQHL